MENQGEPTLLSTPASLQATGDTDPSTKQVFIPQETLDEPFDVTLVAKDGNEFRAHKRVLSKASPFFKKLLKSGMRKSNEGVLRLEMLSGLGLRDILEFIYTGNVQISAEDNAQDLIAMADYFDLPHLKTLVERVLLQELNALNSISTYCFAKRYQCEELIREAKEFINSNFTTVAKTEEFLDLTSQDVKMWISSDEINVSAEEDVFEIILTWIDHEKENRKKYFADLFRQVRLVHISRDFVRRDILTNDLVKCNEDCRRLAQDVFTFVESENYYHLTVAPRKSLVSPALIVGMSDDYRKDNILCYYPREAKWSMFHGTVAPPQDTGQIISCHGQLCFISRYENTLLRYELTSNSWVPFSREGNPKDHWQFVVARNDIYALVAEHYCPKCLKDHFNSVSNKCKRHVYFIKRYKPESNSWEEITSFDLGLRIGVCIVAKDNFIYFLGGKTTAASEASTEADRYDVSTNSWEKIADLQEPRWNAYGDAAYRKYIFIGSTKFYPRSYLTYEVYNELTNKWQLVPTPLGRFRTCMCVDDKVYAINGRIDWRRGYGPRVTRYDPDSNSWTIITQIPTELLERWKFRIYSVEICSMTNIKSCDVLEEQVEEPVGPPVYPVP